MKPPQFLVLSLACALCASLQPVFGGDLKLTETADTLRISQRDKTVLEYVKTARPVPEMIEGVKFLRFTDSRAEYEIGSGRYEFIS